MLNSILRLRRLRADSRPAVFALADAAGTERIRRQAQEAVIAFGEELRNAPPSEDALDAYQAATMVLDTATSLADLTGVLVLVNIGRGGPPPCLFNPLHGPSARQVTWRLLGSREQLGSPPAVLAHKQSVGTGRRKSCRIPCTKSTFLTSMSIRGRAYGPRPDSASSPKI